MKKISNSWVWSYSSKVRDFSRSSRSPISLALETPQSCHCAGLLGIFMASWGRDLLDCELNPSREVWCVAPWYCLVMKWPALDKLTSTVNLLNISIEQLKESDIGELKRKLRKWYPTITVGSESRHLKNSFFKKSVFLNGGNANNDVFPFIFRNSKGLMVGYYTLEVNRLSKSMSGPLGVIDPQCRSTGISNTFPTLMLRAAELMKIELLCGYCTLQHPYIQISFEKAGFKPVGIVPAFDQDRFDDGRVLRVAEVLYAKVLCSDEKIYRPSPKAMTPQVKALWEFLFQTQG